MMQYKAVLFDFDYTLGDATESIMAGYAFAFAEMGIPQPTLEQVRSTVGFILEDGYTMLTGDRDESRRARFSGLFREKSHPIQVATTPLFPGALELLDALKRASVATAVVSSKRRKTLCGVLENTGAMSRLSFALGSDDVHAPKPDPEGILLALERLNTRPGEALYCGDTVLDAEAAQRAGTDFCAVLNGTTPASAFDVWPHVHIAPDLNDLRGYLGL